MSLDTDERTAAALERIADALERAHPVEYRRTGLTAAWDACEVAEGYLDGSGAARPNGNDSMASLDILGPIMTAIATGCDMVAYSLRPQSNAQQTVDAMHAAVALLRETVMRYTGPTVTVDARSLETGEPVPVSVTVQKVADPLDESDHRPRHDCTGNHWRRTGRWWDAGMLGYGNWTLREIASVLAPLTFCDCDDPTDSDRATD